MTDALQTKLKQYGSVQVNEFSQGVHLVTVTLNNGNTHVISSQLLVDDSGTGAYAMATVRQLTQAVEAFEQNIIRTAAEQDVELFMGEGLSYSASRLGRAAQSSYLSSHMFNNGIRAGLIGAMQETDAFQAAKAFERNVLGLKADVAIIEMITPVLERFQARLVKSIDSLAANEALRTEAAIASGSAVHEAIIESFRSLEAQKKWGPGPHVIV